MPERIIELTPNDEAQSVEIENVLVTSTEYTAQSGEVLGVIDADGRVDFDDPDDLPAPTYLMMMGFETQADQLHHVLARIMAKKLLARVVFISDPKSLSENNELDFNAQAETVLDVANQVIDFKSNPNISLLANSKGAAIGAAILGLVQKYNLSVEEVDMFDPVNVEEQTIKDLGERMKKDLDESAWPASRENIAFKRKRLTNRGRRLIQHLRGIKPKAHERPAESPIDRVNGFGDDLLQTIKERPAGLQDTIYRFWLPSHSNLSDETGVKKIVDKLKDIDVDAEIMRMEMADTPGPEGKDKDEEEKPGVTHFWTLSYGKVAHVADVIRQERDKRLEHQR